MALTTRPFCAAFVVAFGAILALGAGCSSDPEPPAQFGGYRPPPNPYANNGYNYNYGNGYGYPAPAAAPAPAPVASQSSAANRTSVHIDDRIVRACGDLPTAHFAFDSANVLPDSASTLDALARCFVSGPLHDKSLKLIGHADPRGETEYNLALGHQRAYSVVDILAQHGVGVGRMAASSKGEFDATGSDEDGWALDRKVDVILGE